MDISIVIPAYNCHKTIERTINSILDAKYKNTLEILLIDDCSKENFSYLKEIYRHENINIIRNKSNLGPGISRNIGIENSKYENICFIDSDDILSSNFFNELSLISNGHFFSTIQFRSIDLFENKNGEFIEKYRPSENIPSGFSKDYLLKTIKGSLPCECWQMIYKKEFLLRNNINFEDGIHEDISFWYEVSLLSKENIYLDKAIYKKIRTSNSIVNTISKAHVFYYFRALENVIKKASEYIDIFEIKKEIVAGVLDFIGSRANRIKFEKVELLEPKNELKAFLISQGDLFFDKFNLTTKSAIHYAKDISRYPNSDLFYVLC